MKNETVTLSPCPFCGCQVTFLTGREDYRVAGKHSKQCPFVDVDLIVDSREAWNTRAALAEPVPPAGGDVEVKPVGYVRATNLRNMLLAPHCCSIQMNGFIEDSSDIALYSQAEVTRLQAEVEQLKRLAKAYIVSDGDRSLREHALRQDNERLQSELTKALELLQRWVIQNPAGRAEQLVSETKSLLLRTAPPETKCGRCGAETACGKMICEGCCYEPVAHQSAPAAKDGEP